MKRLCKWFVLVVLLASEVLLLGGCIYLQQPRAVLKATPTAGNAPLSVTFNLSESADSNPDGAVVRFELQFGDKSSPVRGEDITQPISHTYSEGGYFTAILIVTNNRGNTGYARVHIEVTGAGVKQPVAALAATPLDGEAPLDVTFDLSGSSDPDGWIVHFELQFGDGGLQTGSSMPAQIEHTYADDGFYTAVLEITDNEGLTDYEKVHIAVANPQPVVLLECTPNPAELGELVTCEACSSVDPAGLSLEPRSIIAYEWDFGDGSADFGSCTTTHAYKALGDYEVTLTIFDDDGASVTGSTTVSVQFRESAFVYWSWFDTDSWNGGVKRCPIGGGAPEDVTSGIITKGIAAAPNNLVYWSNGTTGNIDRCCTADSLPCTPQHVFMGQGFLEGMAVDPVNDLVYWAHGLTNTIRRGCTPDLPPCGPEDVVIGQSNVKGLAVDVINNMIYWAAPSTGSIRRCCMGCSDCVPENVYTSSVHWPTGVAVDVVNEMVYWADSLNHTIRRCSTAGPFPCSPEIVCQITAEPYGVAVDGVNNMLYWVVQDEGGSSGKIQRCSTAGSMPKDPQDFLTGLLKPLYIVLGG